MLSDRIISYASRFISITRHDLFLIAVAVLVCLAFWSALYFSRKRVVALRRSSGTDQIALELSRIADALEHIANQPADRVIAAAQPEQNQAQPSSSTSRNMAYSIFRR